MNNTREMESSWSSFFGGCLVILLIFGGGIATFRHFANKEQAKIDALQAELFGPYWAAIQQENFEKAHSLRAAVWQNQNSAESLAKAYQAATAEHGDLTKAYIHVANRFYEPGQELQTMRVETVYQFKDGWKGPVIFELFREEDTDRWQIGNSTTPLSHGLGDGPY